MKKVFYSLFTLAFLATVAVAGNYSKLTLLSGAQDPSQINATINSVINQQNNTSPGLLYVNGTSTPNAGTEEATIYTYSVPAGYLASNGQSLRVRCNVATAATADDKTIKLYFGAASITSSLAANNAGGGWLEFIVTRTGAATQTLSGTGQFGAAGVTPVITQTVAATETLADAIEVKCTGTDEVTAGTIGKLFVVESLR